MSTITGKVSQIIGPVIDVEFNSDSNELPKIYDSLEITKTDGSILVLEVQQHLGALQAGLAGRQHRHRPDQDRGLPHGAPR